MDDDEDNFNYPPAAASGSNSNPMELDPLGGDGEMGGTNADGEKMSKIQELMRHWLNERSSPEVLKCQTELLNGLLDFVADQVRRVCPSSLPPDRTQTSFKPMTASQTC